MAEPVVLTDSTLETVLYGDKPALILFTNGDGVRGDFAAEFRKVADAHPEMVVAKIDPVANPQAAQRFGIGSKPMMIGFYCGDEVVRRNRPWGTDVQPAIEMLQSALAERPPASPQEIMEKPMENLEKQPAVVEDHPIKVTDATFEAEVLNSDKPVLVDFWAEWCGPCRMVAPTLEKLAKEFAGQIRVAKVNTDENPGLSQAFRIMSIPTIMCVKNRTIVFSQPGALPEPAFRDLIQQLIALEVPPPTAKTQPAQ